MAAVLGCSACLAGDRGCDPCAPHGGSLGSSSMIGAGRVDGRIYDERRMWRG
jgi:hypothetical protein